jgi:uncharacterized protein YjbJ (UPF0337 family)
MTSNLRYIVAPQGHEWAVRRNDGDGDTHLYATREEARNKAILLAEDAGVNVLIQDAEGRVEDEVSLIEADVSESNRVEADSGLQGRLNMANETTGLWDKIEGNWKQFSGEVRKQWGKLTDDEMAQINGDRQKLEGRIQEAYGVTREEAGRQIDEWQRKLNL